MTVRLIHGFNVSDGGAGSVGHLRPYLHDAGLRTVLHDYGWTGPLRLRLRNRATIKELLPLIREGDVLVGHSNGCLICWELLEAGAPVSAVVAIQPAMRRTAMWRPDVPVLVLWNPRDLAVLFARPWARLTTAAHWTLAQPPIARRLVPEFRPHGWGSAGRHGFTNFQLNLRQWNTCGEYWGHPVGGHSNVLRPPPLMTWGPRIATWIKEQK